MNTHETQWYMSYNELSILDVAAGNVLVKDSLSQRALDFHR